MLVCPVEAGGPRCMMGNLSWRESRRTGVLVFQTRLEYAGQRREILQAGIQAFVEQAIAAWLVWLKLCNCGRQLGYPGQASAGYWPTMGYQSL